MRTLRLRSLVSTLLLCWSLGLLLASRADAGLGRWTPVGPGGGTVFGLATDPGSPNTLWVATSLGIYKSVDRGETWSSKIAGAFSAVAADPDHPSIVYASGRSVVRSEDGGETWRQVFGSELFGYGKSLAVATGSDTVYVAGDGLRRSTDGGGTWETVLGGSVEQVVIDPATPRTIYAVRPANGYPWLWKSVDAGDTWTEIGGTELAIDIRALTLAPSRPGTLYAATGSGLYRSTDGGATWTARVHPPLLGVTTLVVDPDSPSTVYAGGFHGIAVSTDGGTSWTRQDSGLPDFVQIQTLAFSSGTPRVLYTGMWDYGVARKRSRESHWRIGLQIGLSAGGLLVEIDPVRPGTFYVATAPGRTFRTTDGGRTWTPFATTLTNDLIEDITVDPFHPGTVYAGLSDGLYRSRDDGATWERISTHGSRNIALTDRGNVILAASCGLRRSGDGGLTWQDVIPCTMWDDEVTVRIVELVAIPGRPAVHALVHASDGGGTQLFNLYSSYSHGARWREGIAASDFAVSPFHPATLYTVGSSYPRNSSHRSDDGGRHWKELDLGDDAYSVAVDPRNPEIVYVGGRPVRRSTDGGRTWSDAGAGLELLELDLGAADVIADPTTPGHFFAQIRPGGLFEATFPSP